MSKDSDSRGADQPEDRRDGGGPEEQRLPRKSALPWHRVYVQTYHCNDEKTSVELRHARTRETNVQIPTLELANSVHSSNDQHQREEEGEIREQAVDAEHNKDGGIVGGEVGEVVVDAVLDLAEVCRF